jgi:hypothetical protein
VGVLSEFRSDHTLRQPASALEVGAGKRPEEVRAPTMKEKPHEAIPNDPQATPPQSSLRDASSSIEEERS